jgi:hypothetical protein
VLRALRRAQHSAPVSTSVFRSVLCMQCRHACMQANERAAPVHARPSRVHACKPPSMSSGQCACEALPSACMTASPHPSASCRAHLEPACSLSAYFPLAEGCVGGPAGRAAS